MPTPPHIIGRQVLDLRLGSEREAFGVQEEVRRLYYEQVLPALDAVFTELAGPDEVLRLDRLEIDLGRVGLHELEAVLAERVRVEVEAALRQRMAAVPFPADPTRALTRRPAPEARREALRIFLSTGSLPWWAPAPDAFDPSAEVAAALGEAPQRLVAALRAVWRPAVGQRLVYNVARPVLRRLVAVRMPSADAWFDEVMDAWEQVHAAHPLVEQAPDAFRRLVEGALVEALLLQEPPPGTPAALVAAVAARLYEAAGEAWVARLADAGAEVLARSPLVAAWAAARPAGDPSRAAAPPDAEAAATPLPAPPAPDPAPPRLAEAPASHDPSAPPPSADAPSVPDAADAMPRPASQEADPQARPETQQTDAPGEAVPPAVPAERPDAAAPASPAHDASPKEVPEAAPALREDAPAAVPDASVDEEGAATYLTNAGLLLLWPFLGRFFENVGLMTGKAFASVETQQRAVLLTQYLATGTPETPEHALLLNKLLCGWPLDAPLPPRFAPTDAETEQADGLLHAAIDNWPALKQTSPEGFRNSFLLREGRLVRQPGRWQVQVQRRGYDVLLDRLPWSISIIKLTWMPEPVFVEW